MKRDGEFEDVIGGLYEAATDPRQWNNALEAVGRFLSVDAMLLIHGSFSTENLRVIGATGFDVPALGQYAESYLPQDDTIRTLWFEPGAVYFSSAEWEGQQPFEESTLCRHLLGPSGLAHIWGTAVLNTGTSHSSLWMARSGRSCGFTDGDVEVFSALLPHVTRAVTAYHRILEAERRSEMAMGAFDRVATGVVLLDVEGHPMMVNREAQRIAELGDGFSLHRLGPKAGTSNESARLREIIRRAGSGSEITQQRGAHAMRLTRPSGLPDYHVIVLPLPKRCQPNVDNAVAAVLFITDLSMSQSPVDRLFGDLYKLTKAETRLITQLLEGGGLTAAAERLGLSRNTVHSQLASVFQKTDTTSQSELLTLLLTCLTPIRPPDESSGFFLTPMQN